MDHSMDPNYNEYYTARRREYELRMRKATKRILEMSAELHLTWSEFEEVLVRVKEQAYICMKPMTLGQESNESQSSGS